MGFGFRPKSSSASFSERAERDYQFFVIDCFPGWRDHEISFHNTLKPSDMKNGVCRLAHPLDKASAGSCLEKMVNGRAA